MRGSRLCGGVVFEVARAAGPFELCHCTSCGSPVPDPPPGATEPIALRKATRR